MIEGSLTYYDGLEPCSDSDSGGSDGGGDDVVLLGMAFGSAAAVVVVGLGCFLSKRRRSNRNRKTEKKGQDKVRGEEA